MTLLHLALATWLTAASADTVSTYQVFSNPHAATFQMREANPLLSPLSDHPAALATTMAATDSAIAWSVQRWLAPKHPRLVIVGYFASAAVRGYMAGRNWQHVQQLNAMPVFIPSR